MLQRDQELRPTSSRWEATMAWLAITRNVDGLKGVLGMKEQALRHLIATVKNGKLSRRAFVQRMVALGLTAPMASQMLDYCGVARAQSAFQYKPTKRGGGGTLKILYWQAVTLLNPHFAVGTKDQDGARVFY